MSEKPFLIVLAPRQSQIFWIPQSHKITKIIRNRLMARSKIPAWPKVSPAFFISPKLKNWLFYPKTIPPKIDFCFFGGGIFIKCRFRQVSRTWGEKNSPENFEKSRHLSLGFVVPYVIFVLYTKRLYIEKKINLQNLIAFLLVGQLFRKK